MTVTNQYDLSTSEGFSQAFGQFSYLKEKGSVIEIREIKKTRSYLQNNALHLFFTWAANSLNDAGFEFSYRGIKGVEIEVPWNGELFKNMVWRQIQITLFDHESTTKLTTNEINQILDVLIRHFAKLGLTIYFPNRFDEWLFKAKK